MQYPQAVMESNNTVMDVILPYFLSLTVCYIIPSGTPLYSVNKLNTASENALTLQGMETYQKSIEFSKIEVYSTTEKLVWRLIYTVV